MRFGGINYASGSRGFARSEISQRFENDSKAQLDAAGSNREMSFRAQEQGRQ